MKSRAGFTIIELMMVIFIVSILAAVVVPFVHGRIDKAKWSEANASAGTIRGAVRAYASETDLVTAQGLIGSNLSNADTQGKLGITQSDLEGTYFAAGDYTITDIDFAAVATITVVPSKPNAPSGSYQLTSKGNWIKLGQG